MKHQTLIGEIFMIHSRRTFPIDTGWHNVVHLIVGETEEDVLIHCPDRHDKQYSWYTKELIFSLFTGAK